jgi:hypothetical protein
VLSAHSTYLSATEYFSPLLVNEDGSFDMKQPIVLEKLKLKSVMRLKLINRLNKWNIDLRLQNSLLMMGKVILTRPTRLWRIRLVKQLTLYTCTDIDGENRLVIQADILDKRSLSS